MPNNTKDNETYNPTFKNVPIQIKPLIDELISGYTSSDYPHLRFGPEKKNTKTAMLVTALIHLYLSEERKAGLSDNCIFENLKNEFGIEIINEPQDFQLKNAYNFQLLEPDM